MLMTAMLEMAIMAVTMITAAVYRDPREGRAE